MLTRVFLIASILGITFAQDDRLINVKQIMRDAFDILRNVPAPKNLNEVSKAMFSTTTLPPAYGTPGLPQLSPDEYQALLAARSNRALTMQQRQILYHLQQKINVQKQYSPVQPQNGQQYNPYYQQRTAATQPPVTNPINRIFATPTEKDMERLLRLPADILYKIAEEGHYIDPETENAGYSHAREVDRPLSAGASPSTDSSNPGMFGDGFSFGLQGGDSKSTGPITNPFLTKEDVKKEESSTPEPQQPQAEPKPEEKKESEPAATKEITYQNAGTNVDKSKPYFVVNNGEWQLVVPQLNDKPALQIPVKDFTKLTEAVARASARSGMPVDMTKIMAAEELHVKSSEVTTAASPVETQTEATTKATTKSKKTKKVEKLPDSAFVQEAESLKSEEEETAPATKEEEPKKGEEEVIILNGKRYKLVNEEKPKKKKTKKTKKAQTTGQNTPLSVETSPSSTPIPTLSPTQAVSQNLGATAASPVAPAQFPVMNQPFTPSMLSRFKQQPLTLEQQQILAELQRRYLQSQAAMLAPRPQPQAQQVQAAPYVFNGQNYNTAQIQAPAAAYSMQQPYYQKVSAPATLSQMPLMSEQSQGYIPMKVQPTQAVSESFKAAAAPIVKETSKHIDPTQSSLPKQKVYSLHELDQYYNMQNFEPKTEAAVEEETTTEAAAETEEERTTQKIYAPHKQIKIKMNGNTEVSMDGASEAERNSKTTLVDATADDEIDEEKKRIAELRRRFALERQQLTRRSRVKFEKTTNIEPTTPPSFTVTEQHCFNIKNFARQAGSSNVYDYAVSHCHYIENYYPDLKCANVEDYIKVCQQYYSTRRMLFT